ncbi:Uncharacterized protein conserved in bacteria [Pasteurella multocida]|uniref:RNA polymerase factor sigma-32 n=1 Tax=Pasteurella dagmatis ATCC 43325 TaxID=667128 RepID=C9PP88_9PAST|nr:DUF2322 family protein [Pasteurella dagmatis]EEX50586.1 hypothetical protein HMPREF0621_0812 [Pasteurella dagmatis ATCC 43325]SNV80066.1 Uncharacterized protein conserved in bacteria [Pasteurella dagmatis]VEI58651.1 Uncharacterized protein conserved in bacteria [Pasteurella multocida]
MDFKTILDTLPSIEHLSGLAVMHGDTQVHHIPAIEGKLGSLRVYNALAEEFNGKLDRTSAQKGLQLFAEHTEDAKFNVGKHPNIDLLFHVIENNLNYQLVLQK